MSDDSKLKPALIGGALAGVLSAIPVLNFLNCACCALVIGGGGVAAWLYLRDRPAAAKPPYGDGAMTGIFAGAVGGLVTVLLNIPVAMLTHRLGFGGDPEQLRQVFDQFDLPPAVAELVMNAAEGKFSLLGFVLNLAVTVPLFAVFGMLGGLLAVAIFFKKAPAGPAAWTPPSTPPPAWVPQASPAATPAPAPSPPATPEPPASDEPWPPPPPPGTGGERS